jgi:hypothetical protein
VRIAYENYIDSATMTVLPSADANYPLSNIQDQRLSTIWKATSITAQTIFIDLGSAKAVNTCALMAHTVSTASTVIISGGASSTADTVSTSVSYNSGIMLKFATMGTYRYWKLSLTSNSVLLQAGRLWLGNYITIDPSSLLNFQIIKHRSDNVFHNNTRQKYASPGNKWREFQLSFPPTDETMLKTISTMFDYSRNCNSLIFCNFDTDRSYQIVEPCYCSISGDLQFKQSDRSKFDWSLSLEEEL